jgi:hypothetical protein
MAKGIQFAPLDRIGWRKKGIWLCSAFSDTQSELRIQSTKVEAKKFGSGKNLQF